MRLLASVAGIVLLAVSGCGGGGGGANPSSAGQGGGSSPSLTSNLSLSATGPGAPVPSGTNAAVEFVVTNSGSGVANNVELDLSLGEGLSKAGVQCAASGGATCPETVNATTVATLPAGGELAFSVSVIPTPGSTGKISTTGTVTASNDTVMSDNSAAVDLVVYSSDLSVTGSTSATDVYAGAVVPYSITISNSGPDAAHDVILEIGLSAGQVITSITCAATNANCPNVLTAQMALPELPAGGSLTFAIAAQLSSDVLVSVNNTFRATLLGDSNIANNVTTISAATRIPTSRGSPSFVVFQSDSVEDQVASYSYDATNAKVDAEIANGGLKVTVRGNELWDAGFYIPRGAEPTPGMYTDLLGAPPYDLATGGIFLNANGFSCGTHTGWFAIDDISYAAGQLASVDIRFEQHCYGAVGAKRGQIHWIANDATLPPGPINPSPAGLWQPPLGATPASGNYVYLQGDPGDWIADSRTELLTQTNSILMVSEDRGALVVIANGDRPYSAAFKPMTPLTHLAAGYYSKAQRIAGGNPALGTMDVSGGGHACNIIQGWFVVDSIAIVDEHVTGVDLRFEQHCEGDTSALRGQIHWRSDDTAQPPGPQVPAPPGLWAPPAGAVPGSGNAVYLQSDPTDYIGQGLIKLYTPLDAVISTDQGGMTPAGNRFDLQVRGDQDWTASFQAMSTVADLQPGYYGNVLAFPANNPAIGGLQWAGEGRACNQLTGWFVIDDVQYSGSVLDSIQLRFEQHCEALAPTLHGFVRWSRSDTRAPSPPQEPPQGLWSAPTNAVPASGNYVYLESNAGDFIGEGETHLYTSLDAVFGVTTSASQVILEVQGDKQWRGSFTPMIPLTQLQVGYYGDLTNRNPAKGIMNWYGDGRGEEIKSAWYVVDNATFDNGSITALDLRFEQTTLFSTAPLRGQIHWRFDDPTHPPGPQVPIPSELWKPSAGAVPASGNFLYVESDPGDFVGMGATYLVTPAEATLAGAMDQLHGFGFSAQNSGTGIAWNAHFDNMVSISQLQPGYYANVQGTAVHNPARGGMNIDGNGHACNVVAGWFAIDSIAYEGSTVSSIDVRFEQHCEGVPEALRGRIRWSQ
ncbi:MAG TPA: hypothetical protein VFS47_08365 [Steroidobacteraceae bacterium]|nr:hypothetical protein [Steroidobacteraceae bacterium]